MKLRFGAKPCWLEKDEKKIRLRIADSTLQTEKLHLFSLKPILSSYYSVTVVSSNINRKAKIKIEGNVRRKVRAENKVKYCSTTLQTEKPHLFSLKPIILSFYYSVVSSNTKAKIK